MARRAPESAADYLAIAVCPALIMLLVGSLVFFLIEVFYQGQYQGRLLFVMAMFVMAIVAIARISMEQDVGYASLFAMPLAAVVLLAMSRFVTIEGPLASIGLLVNASFMAIVWWSAHRLTWDCTLIDDMQDVSGQGLLQQMGLDSSGQPTAGVAPGLSVRADDVEAVTNTERQPERPWWERWFMNDRRPHAPGVWVVYFSLAALPLFGFGGWFVPAADTGSRARAFQFLTVYVGSALALLLATSFLGLRRYLRQRRLEMPLEMTATWTALGLAMIVATLVIAAVLPRPRVEYSLTQLPVAFTSAVRRASQFAVGKEGTEDKSQKRATTADVQEGQKADESGATNDKGKGASGSPSSKTGSAPSAKGKASSGGEAKSQKQSDSSQAAGQQGESSGSDQGKSSQSPQSKKSDARGGKSQGSESKGEPQDADSSSRESSERQAPSEQRENPSREESSQAAQSESPSPPPSEPQPTTGPSISQIASTLMQAIGTLFRWLLFLAFLAVGLVLAWIYRAELVAAWQKLLAELRELWAGWWGKQTPAAEAAAAPAPPPPTPFANFPDPFATGAVRRMSWPELIRYTFTAVEAWGRERHAPRRTGQTPHEFAVALGQVEPQLGAPLQMLAAWYSQLAYAQGGGGAGSPDSLRQLWQVLRATAAPPIAAPSALHV